MAENTAVALGREAARRLVAVHGRETTIGPGLTEAEFARIENEYGFEFAADHRAFLAAGLPRSRPATSTPEVIHTWREPWPDWRDDDPAVLRGRLDGPIEGVLFDVEHNSTWYDGWGPRPEQAAERLAKARQELATVPKLVPVYGHRFLPAGSGSFGHPVLSVRQTDIIYYGKDLADYVYREFRDSHFESPDQSWQPSATVPFWRDFL
ncbi:MAG TPA: hypothetical protein VHX38_18560 [Pseudonocardiaceae bacterium]|jgi:hypothetical protein|nr:hypothetical protein [Pseudonocardiaceae bacterium]